jgi:hypothetical protein
MMAIALQGMCVGPRLPEATILALALAMDASAVAAARSAAGGRRRELLVLAFSFGVFQAGMAQPDSAWGICHALDRQLGPLACIRPARDDRWLDSARAIRRDAN